MEGESIQYERPSVAFLNYRKFFFWIGLLVIDLVLFILWVVFTYSWPLAGFLTAPLWLFVMIVPDIVAYIAIHLRYDTTWYVLSDRSMRIRRGIWSINETTITFENIQNANISQGPLQRWFGFANLMVLTAGGGGMGHDGHSMGGHFGFLEGLNNAAELRERVLAKSQLNTGLGDEDSRKPPFADSANPSISATRIQESASLSASPQNVVLLKEIFELTDRLASAHPRN